jgi:hypothetical protein
MFALSNSSYKRNFALQTCEKCFSGIILQRRLASAAKKAIAKIPQKTIKNGDKVKFLFFLNSFPTK